MKPIELLALLLGLATTPAGHDHAGPGPAPCRRASRIVKYHVGLDHLPGVTDAEARGAARAALAEWAALCDLRPVEVLDVAEADLRLESGVIDGPGGILAHSGFPCEGAITTQVYDTCDVWTPTRLRCTISHEFGQALGLDHDHARGVPGLMHPYIDEPDATTAPAESDREQAVARYGPPR